MIEKPCCSQGFLLIVARGRHGLWPCQCSVTLQCCTDITNKYWIGLGVHYKSWVGRWPARRHRPARCTRCMSHAWFVCSSEMLYWWERGGWNSAFLAPLKYTTILTALYKLSLKILLLLLIIIIIIIIMNRILFTITIPLMQLIHLDLQIKRTTSHYGTLRYADNTAHYMLGRL